MRLGEIEIVPVSDGEGTLPGAYLGNADWGPHKDLLDADGNLSRVLPEGCEAAIDWDAWARPAVFEWLARHVDEAELRNVFNLGVGFCAVVPAEQVAGDLVIGEIR